MKSMIVKNTCLCVGLVASFWMPCESIASEGADHNHRHSGHTGHMDSHNGEHIPHFSIQIETGGAPLTAGKPAEITFLITDDHGKAVRDITVSHERLLHVVIISEDFSAFAHIHPEDFGQITDKVKEDARYSVRYEFPRAGRYLIAADTAVQDVHISNQFRVAVEGEPKAGTLTSDLSRKKSFGAYSVTLKNEPETIRAGEKNRLMFEITRNGEPVTDLDHYLGALMHLAVVMTDLNSFIHAHGDVPGSAHDHIHTGHIHGTPRGSPGPEIVSEVVFPKKGTYKIFSQVQHDGKVLLFDFMVEVK